MMKTLLAYVTLAIIFTLLILCIEPLPTVYWSTSQDTCVKIIIKGEDCSCETLLTLDKYEKVWVK